MANIFGAKNWLAGSKAGSGSAWQARLTCFHLTGWFYHSRIDFFKDSRVVVLFFAAENMLVWLEYRNYMDKTQEFDYGG